jgi:hypothetical protein
MGPRLALSPWWTHNHGVTRQFRDSGGHRDRLERERRPSKFSPMVPVGGGAAEMAIQRRLTKAAGGALLGRWFQV